MREMILRCTGCGGDGVLSGPRVCGECQGVGLVADLAVLGPLPAEQKPCACGLAYTNAEWERLELVGFQDDGEGGALELRNCRCRSTMAIEHPGLSAARLEEQRERQQRGAA